MSTPVGTTRGTVSASRRSSVIATKIFIDSVSEYYQMQSCALPPISAIVRDMASGCGDGSQTTSYACFCYDSPTHYSSIISTDVSSACNDQAQATSAQDVFSKYCQIGITRGITPAAATASTTGTASKSTSSSPLSSIVSSATGNSFSMASSSFSNSAASATTAPSSSATPKSSSGRTTTIAVAGVVPVVVVSLVLGLVLFLVKRHRQRALETPELADEKVEEMAGDTPAEKHGKSAAELATHTGYAELPGDGIGLTELPTPEDRNNGFR